MVLSSASDSVTSFMVSRAGGTACSFRGWFAMGPLIVDWVSWINYWCLTRFIFSWRAFGYSRSLGGIGVSDVNQLFQARNIAFKVSFTLSMITKPAPLLLVSEADFSTPSTRGCLVWVGVCVFLFDCFCLVSNTLFILWSESESGELFDFFDLLALRVFRLVFWELELLLRSSLCSRSSLAFALVITNTGAGFVTGMGASEVFMIYSRLTPSGVSKIMESHDPVSELSFPLLVSLSGFFPLDFPFDFCFSFASSCSFGEGDPYFSLEGR